MTTPSVKVGPFGSPAGIDVDLIYMNPPKQLHSMEIWSTSGSNGVIDAISFTYYDERGYLFTVGPWGSRARENKVHKVINLMQGDYVKELSGLTNDHYVTSLTVVTTKASYSCGKVSPDSDKHFRIPVAKGSIVAFFGRADDFLNAIGAYITPN